MQNESLIVNIRHSTNRISADISGSEVWFESDSEFSCTDNFALWLSLPFAMRQGKNLHIDGKISPKALSQARKLVSIWSTWVPDHFSDIEISVESIDAANSATNGRSLMLFSGGVDSTFALKAESKLNKNAIDTLTIFGMDYHISGKKNFDQMLDKTKKFTAKYSENRIIIRSNAAYAMRDFGIDGSYGHGFQLLATLFLFDEIYEEGLIASDYSYAQEYLVAPWGTCSYTNNLFRSEGYFIRTLSSECTRSEKVESLACDDLALESLSFCKDHSIRPLNCGVCSKCMRTKAMFYAATGKIPEIFLLSEFNESDLGAIDLSKRSELMFANDIIRTAKKNGNESGFRKLAESLETGSRPSRTKMRLRKLRGKIRSKIRNF